MKINGKKIEGANYEYIVFPRPTGDIAFKAQAVLDMQPFHDMVPSPKPGKKMVPGGKILEDYDDATYKGAVAQFAEKRYAYIVLKSLEATPGLEWETVQLTDPSTWMNWETETKGAGLSSNEVNQLQLGIATANSLNQDKLDEARNRFLVSLAEEQAPS